MRSQLFRSIPVVLIAGAAASILHPEAALATTVVFQAEWRALEAACEAARRGPDPGSALEALEAVAEGKPRDVIVAAEANRAGATLLGDRRLWLADLLVRAYAMEQIGATDLPQAVHYLEEMTQERVGPDDSQRIFPAAKLALTKALYRRETDPRRQTEFLERELTKPSTGIVALWAEDELCDRGSVGSLPMIIKFVKALDSSPRGDERIRFCQVRMDVVARDTDRIKAIGSVLVPDAPSQDAELMRWAIRQLWEARSRDADAELERYAKEAEERFPDTPAGRSPPNSLTHQMLAQEVRRLQAERAGR